MYIHVVGNESNKKKRLVRDGILEVQSVLHCQLHVLILKVELLCFQFYINYHKLNNHKCKTRACTFMIMLSLIFIAPWNHFIKTLKTMKQALVYMSHTEPDRITYVIHKSNNQ